MKVSKQQPRNADAQRGVALLISIFALMVVLAVGATLILMAGTESAIDVNYRTATQAFFDARAGLEEGRGRLWGGNPNTLGALLPPAGTTLPVGTVLYILNPSAGEVVQPNNSGNAYFDAEYAQEWGTAITGAAVTTTTSTSAVAGLAGPLYKWVRITATTEQSSGHDVNGDGKRDNVNPLFYDGAQQFLANQIPPTATNPQQVYTVTALASTPSGSRRLLQYTVAQQTLNLNMPSALTFDGPTPVYNAPSSNPFQMNGNDRSGKNTTTCKVPPQAAKPAIGDINAADSTTLKNDIPSNRQNHYTGAGGTPSIGDIASGLSANEQTPSGLQSLVASITNAADSVVQGPASSLPNMGTASSPTITVVDGDLSLSGNNTGYGILVVTGTLTFSGNTGWNGVVLVIGQGVMQENGGGNNEFDGAVFVAKTLDPQGNLLPTLGTPTVNWNGGGGNGVYFDSCWIANSTNSLSYQVLSFREISQ